MYYQILGFIFLVTLFLSILALLYVGRAIEMWHERLHPHTKRADTHVTETAIFALLGLLIAFTFSTAAGKFDIRRLLIVEESNAITTAYLRFDILPESSRPIIQEDMRQYLDARKSIYDDIAQTEPMADNLKRAHALQEKIWKEAVSACPQSTSASACLIVLPALNAVFEIANIRMSNLTFHPHIFIFLVIIGLVLLTSILAGYSISTKQIGGTMHYLAYAFVVSVSIYAILDMEYPRVGFIRIDRFDSILFDLKDQLLAH